MSHPAMIHALEIRDADDNVLVYDSHRAKIHVLNRTAGYILKLCDGTRSSQDIARSLSEASGTDFAAVAPDVETILREFAALELLSDA